MYLKSVHFLYMWIFKHVCTDVLYMQSNAATADTTQVVSRLHVLSCVFIHMELTDIVLEMSPGAGSL